MWKFFKRLFKKKTDNNYLSEEQQIETINNNSKSEQIMAKKTVITQVQDVEVNASIIEFPQNRALITEQLSYNEPPKPEIVKGLKTVDDVFEHFKPKVDVEFQNPDGGTKKESLSFGNLADFSVKGMTSQSEFLQELDIQKTEYQKIVKQLKTNKQLRQVISDIESKKALLNAILALLKELEAAK
jgi:hypothetical protein